ncbi:unnamed protein product [Trypanosoma congolense IL3000]|uniref:WGS project CAEQ00000000 data, annotated contig 645 n=1 Tax=Trypanosoma congolense (strain IL3000) TaxID=1068625 RepID=F9WHG3_TRYCI|nr:unnamed protein product [Trypanosoma congolense IL3000]
MWNILQDYASEINKEKVEIRGQSPRHAFYVGDAAGRKVVTLAGRKRDFSCSDRKFAMNIGVPFFTPEQFLSWPEDTLLEDASESQGDNVRAISQRLLSLAQTPCPVDWGGISPVELSSLPRSYEGLTINRITAEGRTGMLTLASPTTFHRDLQEMILFVGYPSCGKTTFFERFLKPHGYVHVNRDKLQTKERCISEATKSWNEGKSVVVDNTNPSHDDCKSFLKIIGLKCSSKGTLPVRLFLFKASKELSMHMSTVRARLGIAPKISRIAFNVFQSKYNAWDARSVKSMNIEELLEIPPVVCFDGLPEGAMREFFMLS